jgi:hypothetical protein
MELRRLAYRAQRSLAAREVLHDALLETFPKEYAEWIDETERVSDGRHYRTALWFFPNRLKRSSNKQAENIIYNLEVAADRFEESGNWQQAREARRASHRHQQLQRARSHPFEVHRWSAVSNRSQLAQIRSDARSAVIVYRIGEYKGAADLL